MLQQSRDDALDEAQELAAGLGEINNTPVMEIGEIDANTYRCLRLDVFLSSVF